MNSLQSGYNKNIRRVAVLSIAVSLAQGIALGQTAEDKPQADPIPAGKMRPKMRAKKSVLEVKPQATQSLAVSVATDKKTYAIGTPIKMTLTAKNTTAQPLNLSFGSGQKYDFILREGIKPDGKIVWQWAKGRMFAQMMNNTKLEAGKSLTFTESFPPTPVVPGGEPLKAGTYTLMAMLATFGERPSTTTQVVIK